MSGHPDLERVARVIEEVAAEAIVPRFRRLDGGDVAHKQGPHDLVTVADIETERLLERRLGALVPGAAIVGEEAAAADPAVMGALKRPGAAWVIDPVDGTGNFAAGLPLFATMVAFVVDGDARAAWICDPMRGVTAIAERGGGARLGDRRLSVSPVPDAAHAAMALNIRYGDRGLVARMAGRADRIASVLLLRSAAQEYLAIAEGRIHAAIYHRALPWDHAAGTLLVEEAGGFVRRLDGGRYRAADDAWGSPIMIAPDEAGWRSLHEALVAG